MKSKHLEIPGWLAASDLSLSDLKGCREELWRIKWDM